MATNTVYVGNLSWDTTDDGLLEVFGDAFSVDSAVVQRHADSSRSKGWALVTFSKEEDVESAIDTFNDTEMDGRTIIVRKDRGATRPLNNGGAPAGRKVKSYDNDTKQRQEEDDAPSTKLFVGNLTWDTTSEMLEKAFNEVGTVASAEVILKPDGRSRGWGIVEMDSLEDAEEALKLDQSDLDGRSIKVQFQKSKTRARKPRRQQRESKTYNDADDTPSKSVYVGNLPWSYTDDDLADLFADFDVSFAEVKQGYDGRSRGYGIVTLSSEEDAASAIQAINDTDCGGRKVVVRYDRGGVKGA